MTKAPHSVSPNFAAAAFQEDLHAHYRDYRQHTPVFCNDEQVVYLTRYADCLELLGNPNFRRTPPNGGCNPFSEAQRAKTPLEEMISHWMIFLDPPQHDRLRKAFTLAFTAKSIKQLEPDIQQQTRQLLDKWPNDGNIEVVEHFAFPLPILVICNILGVPKADLPRFQNWSIQLTQALDSGNEQDIVQGAEVAQQLNAYFSELLSNRKSLSEESLINRMALEHSIELSADELLYGYAFLLWAGHETTKNLLANGIFLLAQHPEAWHLLKTQPTLIDSAVEEMLRFESPLQKSSRWTHAEARFGDYLVPSGTLVTALVGAANRDPAIFTEPECFDIEREKNRHIAFGSGIHHCLGALLARTEARIAFTELLHRVDQLEVLQHQWRNYSAFRSFESLSIKARLTC